MKALNYCIKVRRGDAENVKVASNYVVASMQRSQSDLSENMSHKMGLRRLKRQLSELPNGIRNTLNVTEKAPWPIITGCNIRQLWPMAGISVPVVAKPNHYFSGLTILRIMGKSTGKVSAIGVDTVYTNGLNAIITRKDSKSYV